MPFTLLCTWPRAALAVFTPLTAGDLDWRNHLEHELEAAQHRGDRATHALVTRELERLGSR